ncbi:hypothetical protein H072_8676 [Dactylellina haptotyla CBS 200.50]|uniref:PIPK domain-containing protein n=1 Tax=Dactylellina haptotyla (strain CBS 200.50) TaxID=1284197 RepID=S8A961_DACHA|nr:hypothetical protein H072_8676 [Dactylellina haptotyla CBS 200.50]
MAAEQKNPIDDHRWYSVFSKDYKTRVIDNSIRRVFEEPLGEEEAYDDAKYPPHSAPPIIRTFKLSQFFKLYNLHFKRAAPLLFLKLRTKHWQIEEESYLSQFDAPLSPVSGLGFSGSIFFFSKDRDLIVKSVGRGFEYTFLYTQCIGAYGKYMSENDRSLLCRMTDVLFCFQHHLGGILGMAPSHYVIMENLLKELDAEKGWIKWDLKPQKFFEPTRDLIPDVIKTETAKSGLADAMEDDRIILTKEQKKDLWTLLERDTEFLERIETIDYSLLLGRYPVAKNPDLKPPKPENWATGVTSANGKYVYRACIVDFLWNVNQLQAKITRTAGMILPEQTVTTQPGRYRREFLSMMDEYIDVPDEESPSSGSS